MGRALLGLTFVLGAFAATHGAAARPLTVGLATSIPNQYIENGRARGLIGEIAETVFQAAGLRTRYVELPWARLYESLHEGRMDAAIGVFGTPAMRERAHYSVPLMSPFTVIVARRDAAFQARSVADIEGIRLGSRLGLSYNALARHPGIVLVPAPADDNNIMKLMSHRIDGILLGNVTRLHEPRRRGLLERVEILASVDRIPLGLAFADERFDAAFLARVNAIIGARVNDGLVRRVARRYGLSTFIDPPPPILN